MPPELLALIAATGYAGGQVAVKHATANGSVFIGLLVSLATGTLLVGGLALAAVDDWRIPLLPVILFAIAGIAGPGIARLLSMRSVRDNGATVTTPVIASLHPLVATAGGVFLFDETVGLSRILALLLVVSGIWMTVRGGSANRPRAVPREVPTPSWRAGRYALVSPMLAGGAYAAADVFRKLALGVYAEPLVGAAIGLLVAFLLWGGLFAGRATFRQRLRLSTSVKWFCLSGILSAAAQISLFVALRDGELGVIAPIVASQPVILTILSVLLLRKLEHLRPGTVIGAFVVSGGVAYLSFA